MDQGRIWFAALPHKHALKHKTKCLLSKSLDSSTKVYVKNQVDSTEINLQDFKHETKESSYISSLIYSTYSFHNCFITILSLTLHLSATDLQLYQQQYSKFHEIATQISNSTKSKLLPISW